MGIHIECERKKDNGINCNLLRSSIQVTCKDILAATTLVVFTVL